MSSAFSLPLLKHASITVWSGMYSGDCSRNPTFMPRLKTTSPLSYPSLPDMMFSSVDLPVPLRPMIPIRCLSAILNEAFSNKIRSPILLFRSFISRYVFTSAIFYDRMKHAIIRLAFYVSKINIKYVHVLNFMVNNGIVLNKNIIFALNYKYQCVRHFFKNIH